MSKLIALRTKSQEVRFKGMYKNEAECLEAAIAQNIPLDNLKLTNLNLSCANLDGGRFRNVDFSHCNLNGANMSECDFEGANFSYALLSDACLCESNFKNASFFESSFSSSDVTSSYFEGCLFSCRSAFSLSFQDARTFKDCKYYAHGQHCAMSRVPVSLQGLGISVYVLDDHIMIGQSVHTLSEWAAKSGQKEEGAHKSQQTRMGASSYEIELFRVYGHIIKMLMEMRSGIKQAEGSWPLSMGDENNFPAHAIFCG